jgi:hypothetical protein
MSFFFTGPAFYTIKASWLLNHSAFHAIQDLFPQSMKDGLLIDFNLFFSDHSAFHAMMASFPNAQPCHSIRAVFSQATKGGDSNQPFSLSMSAFSLLSLLLLSALFPQPLSLFCKQNLVPPNQLVKQGAGASSPQPLSLSS